MFRLGSRQFERRLRATARTALRRSDAAWGEYRRRIRFRWLWRTVMAFGVLGLASSSIMMPVSFSMPLFMGILAEKGPLAGVDNGETLILALHCLQLSGLMMLLAGSHDRAYFAGAGESWMFMPQQNLRAMAHLPIADELLKRVRWIDVSFVVWLLLVFAAIPYGLLALQADVWRGQWWLAVATWLLHVVVTVATGAIAVACSPVVKTARIALVVAGLSFLVGPLLIAFAVPALAEPVKAALGASLSLTPMGWTSAAFLHGVIEGMASGWAWLAPVGLLIAVAVALLVARVCSGFSLREFIISPVNGQWYGVIGRGFRVPRELPPPPPLMGGGAREAEPVLLLEFEAADAVSPAALQSDEARRQDFLDRWNERLMSRRERELLSMWSGSYGRLTRQWWSAVATAALFLAFSNLLVDWNKPGRDAALIIGQHGATIITLAGRIFWLTGLAEGWAVLAALYPLRMNEIARASFKQEALRGGALLPMLAAYDAIAARLTGAPHALGVAHAVAPLALLLATQPMVNSMKLSLGTDDTKRVGMWFFWLGGGGIVLVSAFAATMAPWLSLRFAAIALVAAVCWLAMPWYVRAFEAGRFDALIKPLQMYADRRSRRT